MQEYNETELYITYRNRATQQAGTVPTYPPVKYNRAVQYNRSVRLTETDQYIKSLLFQT